MTPEQMLKHQSECHRKYAEHNRQCLMTGEVHRMLGTDGWDRQFDLDFSQAMFNVTFDCEPPDVKREGYLAGEAAAEWLYSQKEPPSWFVGP